MRLSEESIRHRSVISADGRAIGEVAGITIDSESWRIESLLVKLHRDVATVLGAERSMFHASAVDVPVRLVQSVGDAVVLALDTAGLRQLIAGGARAAATGVGEQPPGTH